MKIIYEQGDIVYNLNNFAYGIVLAEHEDVSVIIELSKDAFVNYVPKGALQYKGHTDIKTALKKIVDAVVHPTEKGGVEK